MIRLVKYILYIWYIENRSKWWNEKVKKKVIRREVFNVKESQRYNVSVQMNYHQD